MTTSKRTTRNSGSRPDPIPSSASAHGGADSGPMASSASPPKARVRSRKAPVRAPVPAEGTPAAHAAANAPPADRYASIALAAYFRSQRRGFKPGHEMEDWLAAEAEVDQRLRGEGRALGDSSG
jgi:hypothetical protein